MCLFDIIYSSLENYIYLSEEALKNAAFSAKVETLETAKLFWCIENLIDFLMNPNQALLDSGLGSR